MISVPTMRSKLTCLVCTALSSSATVRFEHLGDAVLGFCVTSLMTRLYPGLHVGPSTVSAYMPSDYPAIRARAALAYIETIDDNSSRKSEH